MYVEGGAKGVVSGSKVRQSVRKEVIKGGKKNDWIKGKGECRGKND